MPGSEFRAALVRRRGSWGRWPSEFLIRFVASNFPDPSARAGLSVLELGCGPGANLWYLAKEGFKTYGLDISPTALELAQHRLTEERVTAELTLGDVAALPYPEGSFAAVIDHECLYATSHEVAAKALGEVRRVLQPGGLFFSRSFSLDTDVGTAPKRLGRREVEASEGPLAGTGYARLMGRDDIDTLYGRVLELVSVDQVTSTRGNGTSATCEWLIVCRRPE